MKDCRNTCAKNRCHSFLLSIVAVLAVHSFPIAVAATGNLKGSSDLTDDNHQDIINNDSRHHPRAEEPHASASPPRPGRYLPAEDPLPNRYIVHFNDPSVTPEDGKVSTLDETLVCKLELLHRCGGQIIFNYTEVFDGFAVSDMDHECIMDWLQEYSGLISTVADDCQGHAEQTTTAPSWGLDRIDQTNLPLNGEYDSSPWTGQGVDMYIIDTGTRLTHDEFRGRIMNGYDAIDNDLVANDEEGHGTHVASTAAGSQYGVAPQATIIPVRVLNEYGSGSAAGLIAGIDWMIANYKARGEPPSVANLSLGFGYVVPDVDDAVKTAHDAGIVIVAAAGNSASNACYFTPAGEPTVITVGSSTSYDYRSDFSNFGSCVDLFAPGSSIVGAGHYWDSYYFIASGTSMASPHVAGAAALVLQANPTKTPDEVATELVNMATSGILQDVRGSPNKLLFVGNISAEESGPPQARVRIEIIKDQHYNDTSFTLEGRSNGGDSAWVSLEQYKSNSGAPVATEVDLTDGEYYFTLSDSSGDGLCCRNGHGRFRLIDTGAVFVFAQGDVFASAVVVQFKVANGQVVLVDINIPKLGAAHKLTCEGSWCSSSSQCCPGTSCEAGLNFKSCQTY